MEYLIVKWLHIVSSTLLFGTGIGSAFYLFAACLSGDVRFIATVARWVVRADWLFTFTTAIAQPLTGFWMLRLAGIPVTTRWVMYSLALYALAIACWIPVVGLQMRLRDIAARAAGDGTALPPRFRVLLRWWVALGFPALFAFLAIFWLMTAKPA